MNRYELEVVPKSGLSPHNEQWIQWKSISIWMIGFWIAAKTMEANSERNWRGRFSITTVSFDVTDSAVEDKGVMKKPYLVFWGREENVHLSTSSTIVALLGVINKRFIGGQ